MTFAWWGEELRVALYTHVKRLCPLGALGYSVLPRVARRDGDVGGETPLIIGGDAPWKFK